MLNSENGKTRNVPFSSGSSKVLQCAFCTVRELDLLVVCTMQGVQVRGRDRGPRASSFDAPHPPRRCAFWTAGRTVRSKSSSSSRCRRCPRPPDKVRRDCPARASATSIGPTRDRVLERRRCHVCAGHRRGRRRSGYLHRCGARRAARAARGFGRSPVILWTRRDSLRRAQAARTARCSFSSSSRTARPSCDAR